MNAPPRRAIEIDRDLLSACRRIGSLGMKSELTLSAPNIDELTRAAEGLSAVLRERRTANVMEGAK